MLGQACFGRCRCIAYVQLFQWQDVLQVTQQGRSVFLRPQVDVDGVYFVKMFLFVVLVVRAQVPLFLGGNCRLVQHEGEQRRLLVRVY